MDRVKRLIYRAKDLPIVNKYSVNILFVEPCPLRGGWSLSGLRLYRSTMKAADSIDLWAKTLAEAEKLAQDLAEKHPPLSGELKLIICDGLED